MYTYILYTYTYIQYTVLTTVYPRVVPDNPFLCKIILWNCKAAYEHITTHYVRSTSKEEIKSRYRGTVYTTTVALQTVKLCNRPAC